MPVREARGEVMPMVVQREEYFQDGVDGVSVNGDTPKMVVLYWRILLKYMI